MKDIKEFTFMTLTVLILIITGASLITLSPTPRNQITDNNTEISAVLGEQDTTIPQISLVSGIHKVIQNEHLTKYQANHYIYKATIRSHLDKRYSKPILSISNSNETSITFALSSHQPLASNISIMVDNKKINLTKSPQQQIKVSQLKKDKDHQVYLIIDDSSAVNYDQDISLDIIIH